jgi:hypothetical protein
VLEVRVPRRPRGRSPSEIEAVRGWSHNETMAATADVRVSEHVQHVPVAALRPYVAVFTGYRDVGAPPGWHRGLPSPYLTVIFTLHEPLVIAAHRHRGIR